jgi:YHS domain-containing protein
VLPWCSVIACLLVNTAMATVNADPLQQLVKPNPVVRDLNASPLFAGKGDGVTTCPETGEKITTKKLKADYYGRTVYFCCHGCLKAAKVLPDKFIKPTMAEQQQAVKAVLANAATQGSSGEEYCNE